MGYWLADGSVTRKSFVSIAQLGTDANIKNIRSCVERMGFMAHNSKDNVSFNNKTMRDYLSQFGHAADKFVPAIIKQASRRQIRIFLKAFVSCDGHVRTPHPFIGNRGGLCISARDERVYYTSSKQLAADLGELILKAGHRPSYSINSTKGTVTHFRNGDYAANYDSYSIRETYAPTATVFMKERVNYVGKVYDLTLERNHIMYIRRNGKCFWGSNCRCYSVPIIKTDKEYLEDAPSASEVKDVPDNFKKWVENNQDRVTAARSRGTEPYFIRDNTVKVDKVLKQNFKLSPLEIAAQRHAARTPEQIADIKANAQKREQRLLELSNNKIYRQLQELQRKGNVNILAIAGEFVVTKNDYGVLRIHLRHGSNELVENIAIATDRMKRHGYMIDLLEKVEGKSCADSYNRTLKRTEEYKVNTKKSVNSIDRLIRDGARQADVIVLRIDSDISLSSLRDGIHNRAHRCSNLKEIIVIKNDKEAIYKRSQFCSDSFEIKQGDFQ
jgi:hypothetical protein